MTMREAIKFGGDLALIACLCGCSTLRETFPARTATEQLLISTAADRAMGDENFSGMTGQRVFVDDKYFESYDKGYAVCLIRERLYANGALMVTNGNQADVIMEIRSGALSIDNTDFLFGLP